MPPQDPAILAPVEPSSPLTGLTPREAEVARLASDGLTNREISQRLQIASDTVKTHVSRILAKLGCRRRVDLARLLAR